MFQYCIECDEKESREDEMKQASKRKLHDSFLQSITYGFSLIAFIVLSMIFLFIFSKGSSLLSFDLLKNDYWSKNYLLEVNQEVNHTDNFTKPDTLSDEVYFSSKWGIAFIDYQNHEKEELILIEYVDEQSPFRQVYDMNAKQDTFFDLQSGLRVEKIDYKTTDGTQEFTGAIAMVSAKDVASDLDTKAEEITSLYVKTPGGGIRGSIISTIFLIFVSLCLALPIGIASAIYLYEYGTKRRFHSLLRSGIETLTGVPSIVYGLMGVTVLFPITQLFGATTTNLLLGGFTLAIILLPTIIRSTEEALFVVPKDLREASFALGANQSQTIFKIVLPSAVPGILTGILLSVGRVIGESAALIYACGTFINDSPALLSQGTSLAVHIWSIMSGEQPNFELSSAISIIILIFVLILNISVKWLSKKLNKAY